MALEKTGVVGMVNKTNRETKLYCSAKTGKKRHVGLMAVPLFGLVLLAWSTVVPTFFSSAVMAETQASTSASNRFASIYGPTVVKIHNSYCLDVLVDGKPFLSGYCNAGTGSGFFVGQDGYIVTNGHLAEVSGQSAAINSVMRWAKKGDEKGLNYILSNFSKFKLSDIPEGTPEKKGWAIVVDELYKIDAKLFSTSNSVQNLMVDLAEERPDDTVLADTTKSRKEYQGTDKIKRAKVVASDYRYSDGYDGFRASDVAIIKIDGSNYPVAKLGSFDLVDQGSIVSVFGFGGSLTDDGKVKLKTAKVSSKINAPGSDRQLIEPDFTIGHYTSGGPALNDDGYVVGVATFTFDEIVSDNGGKFNYIRDIKDVKDLAQKESITFDANSTTQREWQKGLNAFYAAHYSKALKSFEKVQSLYPVHPTVNEFIDASKTRIENGEDIKDFPVLTVFIGGVVLLFGVVVGYVLILRHKKKRNVSGMQPVVASSQEVIVDAPVVAPLYSPVDATESPLPIEQPQATPPENNNPWFDQSNTMDDSPSDAGSSDDGSGDSGSSDSGSSD